MRLLETVGVSQCKKIITKHHRQKINNNGTDAKLFVNLVFF